MSATDSAQVVEVLRPELARSGRRPRPPLAWLGVAPFLAYAVLFLLLPAGNVLVGAFEKDNGGFTLGNVSKLFQAQFLNAYETSVELSLVTAALGGVLGVGIAYAALREGTPRFVRPLLTSFSGVAANFGGVPLAFAFIATLGSIGVVTRALDAIGIHLYAHGFAIYHFWGLAITYLYFQIPLTFLVIAPAVEGLRREWRDAAASLGASAWRYWLHVGIPVLTPSFLGAVVLLFGNAFAAYATAYALTSGQVNIVPLLIGAVLSGNVLSDPHLGQALSLGMLVVMAVTMAAYAVLNRRASRWTRR